MPKSELAAVAAIIKIPNKTGESSIDY